jgi:predicted metallopeptidase
MRYRAAVDIANRLRRVVQVLSLRYIDVRRVRCVRVFGSRANALARIWGLPPVFQGALRLTPHYVIEFMVPAFDRLPREEQDRTIIHELLHIPKTFSGGIRPERSPSLSINRRTVERYYRQYLAAMRRRGHAGTRERGTATHRQQRAAARRNRPR